MSVVMHELLALLDLENLEVNLFRGGSHDYFGHNVFGGQVLGQALMAAGRTVENNLLAHSLHAYFLRPGNPKSPIVYSVERVRDGRSFTTRTVKAIQFGEIIFTMMASFATEEDGFDHQLPMPDVEGPEAYTSELDLRRMIAPYVPEKHRAMLEVERPIELRPIDPVNPFDVKPQEPVRGHWMKSQMTLPDDPFLHQCMLAFASDFALMGTAMLPHAAHFMQPEMQCASIDHAMWFHREARMDEWLYYHMDAPSASSAKGMNRGLIYTRDGRLVASTAQEGLQRRRAAKSRDSSAPIV
ncbi:acyl-CoA thioesterase-2 [Paraperlucidibaca baekdonensis]|uniref:Acyl-CoA thioesterase 2 n=1 Tax=Paraperlucidibaca baekdonensis TaxID=748120 RepID=A0A3E0H5P1_9GAMM|nr:acyl-CoA thioesterase II [Paraperlucidibaca baekdonensis]REH37920.1 acyl-CoA thioesterase-2 [Paraperlucidibaca baekdonensis]